MNSKSGSKRKLSHICTHSADSKRSYDELMENDDAIQDLNQQDNLIARFRHEGIHIMQGSKVKKNKLNGAGRKYLSRKQS